MRHPMRLVVTRPAAQASDWVERLVALGVPAVALPLITIEPVADAAALRAAWAGLASCRFVMFVSGNAVQHYFHARPEGIAWPPGLRAGATGPGTAKALVAAGLAEALVVQPAPGASWDAEGLWAGIGQEAWAGARVQVVRGESGRDWLAERWRGAGAQVEFVEAYRRARPAPDAAGQALLAEVLAKPAAHLWLFSSSEAIDNLCALVPEPAGWTEGRALATHPRIAETARRAGFGSVGLTDPSLEAVVTAWRHAAARAPA